MNNHHEGHHIGLHMQNFAQLVTNSSQTLNIIVNRNAFFLVFKAFILLVLAAALFL